MKSKTQKKIKQTLACNSTIQLYAHGKGTLYFVLFFIARAFIVYRKLRRQRSPFFTAMNFRHHYVSLARQLMLSIECAIVAVFLVARLSNLLVPLEVG